MQIFYSPDIYARAEESAKVKRERTNQGLSESLRCLGNVIGLSKTGLRIRRQKQKQQSPSPFNRTIVESTHLATHLCIRMHSKK